MDRIAENTNPSLSLKLNNLPDSPGCYLMKSQGRVIYVGKAVNLKNRVRQYFQSSRGHSPKVEAMVQKIDDFDIVLVSGELEALILECNLIKLHQPWYNILLKDDKHYPYIRIDLAQDFPKVDLVRRIEKDGARYFGPYFGASVVREMLDVVRKTFPIRTCNRTIRPDKPQRPCVLYEIGQCVAPCAGKVTREEYHQIIAKVVSLLTGNVDEVVRELARKMEQAALQMQYERAALYRDRIRAVEDVMQKQRAILTGGQDQDILAVAQEGPDALVEALYMRDGKIIGAETFEMPRSGDESPGQVLTMFMLQYYDEAPIIPREILVMEAPEEMEVLSELLSEKKGARVQLHAPQRGEKKRLMDLAVKNARDAAQKRQKAMERTYARTTGALVQLQQVLGLENLPRRIEAYDISNTQGVLSVGSMVVMLDGLPANKEYRRFRIKTVSGPNDFASMHEVLTRRLRHGILEIKERQAQGLPPEGGKFSHMPDLILIDGGPEQLRYARRAMSEQGLSIPMFALAKRLEEIVLPDRDETILIDRRSNALHLLQRLRDEAHRFAITHHRKLRGSAGVKSQLEDVPGIGKTRRKSLLKHFSTIEKLKGATVEELRAAPGMNDPAARAVYSFFHPEPPEENA